MVWPSITWFWSYTTSRQFLLQQTNSTSDIMSCAFLNYDHLLSRMSKQMRNRLKRNLVATPMFNTWSCIYIDKSLFLFKFWFSMSYPGRMIKLSLAVHRCGTHRYQEPSILCHFTWRTWASTDFDTHWSPEINLP